MNAKITYGGGSTKYNNFLLVPNNNNDFEEGFDEGLQTAFINTINITLILLPLIEKTIIIDNFKVVNHNVLYLQCGKFHCNIILIHNNDNDSFAYYLNYAINTDSISDKFDISNFCRDENELKNTLLSLDEVYNPKILNE